MPTPKKKPPQKKKTPPQRTEKPKQNLTSKPAKQTPKKSINRLSSRKEGQPTLEPILKFFKATEIPSPLELAKLAILLATAENEKPSPERALEFLEEAAKTIIHTRSHIAIYESSRRAPLDFKSGIRYIIGAKGQSRPKRELEEFRPILVSHFIHEVMEREYEMEHKDEYFQPPSANDFDIAGMVDDYIQKKKKEGFPLSECDRLRFWNQSGQFESRFWNEWN
jgi:hypothetical protein